MLEDIQYRYEFAVVQVYLPSLSYPISSIRPMPVLSHLNKAKMLVPPLLDEMSDLKILFSASLRK
jgi:hypothetical protein